MPPQPPTPMGQLTPPGASLPPQGNMPQPPMPAPASAMPSLPSMPPMESEGGVPKPLPEWNRPASSTGGPAESQKKALLQKLMSNLLGKPGRSFHELTNGLKKALSAYKSFSTELDTINGGGAATSPSPSAGGSSSGIQDILNGIQAKKDGGGGPGYGNPIHPLQNPRMQATAPSQIPQIPDPMPQQLISGQP